MASVVTRPPTTPVSRVDFLLQNEIARGESSRDTDMDIGASQSNNKCVTSLGYVELIYQEALLAQLDLAQFGLVGFSQGFQLCEAWKHCYPQIFTRTEIFVKSTHFFCNFPPILTYSFACGRMYKFRALNS